MKLAVAIYGVALLSAVIAETLDQDPASEPVSQEIHPLAIPPQTQQAAAAQTSTDQTTRGKWRYVTIKSGDTLSSIFSELDIHSELATIMGLGEDTKVLKSIHPGNSLDVRISDRGIEELIYALNSAEFLYVQKDPGAALSAKLVSRPVEMRLTMANGEITHSLFGAGQRAGLSDKLIMELANIFGWDIDFALDIRAGDTFTVLYEQHFLEGEKLRDGNIVAAEFTTQGQSYRGFRFERADGQAEYYSPEGRPMRKAFLRTPVNFARISSHFNLKRKHPILNKIRAHKGVDYAAPKGTPIKAAGAGKVIHRGSKNGYGKTIIIQHGSEYSTLYGHMSGYAKKAKVGKRVKQGQIIGYVGKTGLATGNHLHYEFRVNGVHRNPLTVKLPNAKPLPKGEFASFIEASKPLAARLDLYTRALVAAAGNEQ